MFLSIIVPAFNEEKLLAQSLGQIQQALNENLEDGSWEIIVCDNNSTDRTAEIASQVGARVIFEPVNQISRARNRGASIAEGEWFLFIDADSYPPPALIADVLEAVRSGDIIGCGSTLKLDGPRWFKRAVEGKINQSARLFKLVGGAFILCQADAFREISGFSDDFYAMEDLDFVRRLSGYGRKQGKRFTVLHRHPYTTSGRKAELYSIWDLLRFAFFACLSPTRVFRSPKRLGLWYDGRR